MLRRVCRLLIFLLIIFGYGAKGYVRDRFNQSKQLEKDTELDEDEQKDPNLPMYLTQLGKLGYNYDLDLNSTSSEHRNKPFIYCEYYSQKECPSDDPANCTIIKKCYGSTNSHHLGCMAVLVYNTLENGTVQEEERPHLKDCWTQEATQMRECRKEDECVVSNRNTGALGRTAKFCCCRTHLCNGRFTYMSDDEAKRLEEEQDAQAKAAEEFHAAENEVQSQSEPNNNASDNNTNNWFLAALCALLVLLLCATFFIGCFVLTQVLRRKYTKKGIKQIQPSYSQAAPRLPSSGADDERRPLEKDAEVDLKDGTRVRIADILLIEKISDGRFGQVYKAKLDERILAVKQFPESAEESWTREMDLYSLKAVDGNDAIAKFMSGFFYEKKFWLLMKFYERLSLFDFLKANTVNLTESVRMMASMLDGLAFLHEEISSGEIPKPSIVHRDLKSKNILVKDDLTTCITDFGLAMRCDRGTAMADQSHLQVGTRRYMSPEVLEGATEFSSFAFQQIDVYAAALVLWEVLSRTRLNENDELTSPFLLPYEKEVGSNPSIVQIRELVAAQKFRPQIRPELLQNEISLSIVRTMSEMWDHEPDGRITSSCARDRSRQWLEGIT